MADDGIGCFTWKRRYANVTLNMRTSCQGIIQALRLMMVLAVLHGRADVQRSCSPPRVEGETRSTCSPRDTSFQKQA